MSCIISSWDIWRAAFKFERGMYDDTDSGTSCGPEGISFGGEWPAWLIKIKEERDRRLVAWCVLLNHERGDRAVVGVGLRILSLPFIDIGVIAHPL